MTGFHYTYHHPPPRGRDQTDEGGSALGQNLADQLQSESAMWERKGKREGGVSAVRPCAELCKKIPAQSQVYLLILGEVASLADIGGLLRLAAAAKPQKCKQSGMFFTHLCR